MKFSLSSSVSLLALASLGLAAPTKNDQTLAVRETAAEPGQSLAKRVLGGIYICSGFGWTGDCRNIVFPSSNFCWSLAPQLASTLSAIGADGGTWCMLYTQSNCAGGGSDAFSYPGMKQLDGYWGTWNDNTKSIKCWW